MFKIIQFDQDWLQKRAFDQIERPLQQIPNRSLNFLLLLGSRETLQIDHRQPKLVSSGMDYLKRLPIPYNVTGAPNLVSTNDVGQASLQGNHTELSCHAQLDTFVVKGRNIGPA